MTFKFKQKEIAALCAAPAKLPKANSTMAVVECLRMIFTENGVNIAATDFECWLSRETNGFKERDKGETFAAVVPARSFHSLMSGLSPDTDITITGNPKKMTVKTKTSTYNFGSLPVDEWPDLKLPEKMKKAMIPAKQLHQAIAFTIVSSSLDDNRYYLNGIHFSEMKGGLRLVGCDGHRLSHYFLEGVKEIGLPDQGVIIPRKTAQVLLELIADADERTEVEFCASEANCSFRIVGDNNFHLRSKLIDGQFPDIDRLIPYDEELEDITLPCKEMVAAINRIGIVTDKKTRQIVLDFEGKNVSIKANFEHDDAEEKIETGEAHKALNTALNGQYLTVLLEAYKGDRIHFLIKRDQNIDKPVALVIVDSLPISKKSKSLSILMPMRG